jgi:hypothetical protein
MVDFKDVKFTFREHTKNQYMDFKGWVFDPTSVGHSSGVAIGFDPGVNFGLTIIMPHAGFIFAGSLAKQKCSEAYGSLVHTCLEDFLLLYAPLPDDLNQISQAVIEGASYNSHFQTHLAHIRTGMWILLEQLKIPAVIMAPMSVRKMVTGSGKIKLNQLLPDINPNGADSLGMAIAASMLMKESLK